MHPGCQNPVTRVPSIDCLAMGILDWWDTALGTFKHDSHYKLKGKTFAVNLSIGDFGKLAQTSLPPYKIKQIHNSLSEHITLVYVYDSIAPPHKDGTKEERRKRREKAGKAWLELRNAVLTEPSKPIDPEVLMKATASRMDMNHPTAVDHANILKWMKEENIRCYGSIAEADQQMINSRWMEWWMVLTISRHFPTAIFSYKSISRQIGNSRYPGAKQANYRKIVKAFNGRN